MADEGRPRRLAQNVRAGTHDGALSREQFRQKRATSFGRSYADLSATRQASIDDEHQAATRAWARLLIDSRQAAENHRKYEEQLAAQRAKSHEFRKEAAEAGLVVIHARTRPRRSDEEIDETDQGDVEADLDQAVADGKITKDQADSCRDSKNEFAALGYELVSRQHVQAISKRKKKDADTLIAEATSESSSSPHPAIKPADRQVAQSTLAGLSQSQRAALLVELQQSLTQKASGSTKGSKRARSASPSPPSKKKKQDKSAARKAAAAKAAAAEGAAREASIAEDIARWTRTLEGRSKRLGIVTPQDRTELEAVIRDIHVKRQQGQEGGFELSILAPHPRLRSLCGL